MNCEWADGEDERNKNLNITTKIIGSYPSRKSWGKTLSQFTVLLLDKKKLHSRGL